MHNVGSPEDRGTPPLHSLQSSQVITIDDPGRRPPSGSDDRVSDPPGSCDDPGRRPVPVGDDPVNDPPDPSALVSTLTHC